MSGSNVASVAITKFESEVTNCGGTLRSGDFKTFDSFWNTTLAIPFRFKAGPTSTASMASVAQHHHRSTTKSSNKSFKSRHSTKSALKELSKGKVEKLEKGSRKTPQQHVMSKLDRKNHAKQHRLNKTEARREEGSVFAGRDSAPRTVAVIPLCQDVNVDDVLKSLNDGVEVEDQRPQQRSLSWRIEVPRFKQKVQYITPPRELIAALDACRVADFVLFVLSAQEEVDALGEQMLRCIESQGVSTVITGVSGLDHVEPAKKRPDVLKSLKSYITHFFASQEKVHDLSNRQDCSNAMRSLCTTMPKGIYWREDRSWMLLDESRLTDEEVTVTGVVRGKSLKVDRLVQVGDWGDFQIEKIVAAPLESRQKRVNNMVMTVDSMAADLTLQKPSEDQDDLAALAPEETVMDDAFTAPSASIAPSEKKAVLLDDHHYFHKDERDEIAAPKRLPKGTSKYQAAWFLGDMSDDGSDMEDVDEEDDEMGIDGAEQADGPAEGHFDDAMPEPTEIGGTEYPQSEMFNDPAPEDEDDQLQAYRKQRRDEAEEDREFPDEIELHPGVDARERLARYRGLKSMRTSAWDTEEDKPHEPEVWNRLLEIGDYKSAKNRVLKEALLPDGVKAGTRVRIHLRVGPAQLAQLQALPSPTSVFSLLRHEHKQTGVNCSINLSSEYDGPLKSKTPLILQCGARRLAISPLFSQPGNTPNNVHKFDRYLHPGRAAVASFIGPLIWGSVPCLYFRPSTPALPRDAVDDLAQALKAPQTTTSLEFIGTGTSLPPSTSRVVAKRIILTGHPYKIHKKLVTVRYMFFNDADVDYFRALQLWTKRGRSGYMKEALGTHGYFKATFDGKINPLDAVAVSLYKRVWPREAKMWTPGTALESAADAEKIPDVTMTD
nr:ribosome biogenesis protein tsr1 [Quercus suber]